MRLLWYGETPYIETGAGQVAKHLLPLFLRLFERVHLVPINQWWEQKNLPERLTIAPHKETEEHWNMENARNAILARDYDCLFLTADINRIEDLREEIEQVVLAGIPIIMYAAVDSMLFARNFYDILRVATRAVVFSHWARSFVQRMQPDIPLKVIYHGAEPDVFYPLPDFARREARKRLFNVEDDTFVVLNVNRNQARKDIARSMAAFHLFHLENPDSVMYVHAKQIDYGGNLPLQAAALGMKVHAPGAEIFFAPEAYSESIGVSRSELNNIYNSADAFITSSTGEGWGLTTVECMAAGTPIIAPNNSVFPEQLGEPFSWAGDYSPADRGLLVKSGGPDLWATFYGFSDCPRPICSVTGMKNALLDVYRYSSLAADRAVLARRWAASHAWDHVCAQWEKLIVGVLR